ncbi:MAG: hypothetical protein M3Q44_06360 [bacterium]|nr:hypothetical protein [bacterium]
MKLVLLALLGVVIVGYTAFTIIRPSSSMNFFAGSSTKIETVQASPIRSSKKIYADKKSQNTDFEKSPCLSEDMGNGYALDIVHNPREQIDDQVYCTGFSQGNVKHIVEMTPDGSILRVQ